MIRKWLLLLVLLPGATLAFDLDALQTHLSTTETLQGRFEQQRYLADIESQLNSSGRFLYERDTRVVWILETPVQERLEFTPESAAELGDTTDHEQRQSQVATLFLRLLGGDWQALEERFAVDLSGDADSWQVTLVPDGEVLRERLERIELDGGEYLERLELHAANDDVLTVRFFDQQPLDASANSDDKTPDALP